ncbi:MAG: DUF1735 domain-containing protein [Bacteroidetes bacterium]|nr:DUF1735 domain-containing protein [Bacteroidota bacterium]
MNMKSSILVFLSLALGFTACIKKEVTPLKDEGSTFVKVMGGSSPATVQSNAIDFVPTPQTFTVCDVRKDAANAASLNRATTVTIKDDTAAVRAANPNYLQLPTNFYTLVGSGVTKSGGMGGNYTVTFSPGDFVKEIQITVPNAQLLNPSRLYGLGFTITEVSADSKISFEKSIVVEIGAKNSWDGVYEMSGTFTDVVFPAFVYLGAQQYSLITISATRCIVRNDDLNGGIPGYIFSNAGAGTYYGSYGLVISFDPATNKISDLHNYYGDPSLPATLGGNPAAGTGPPLYASANGRRAVLDPSGVNAVQSNKDIVIKHWLVQPSVVPNGPRSFFNERWKYLGPR